MNLKEAAEKFRIKGADWKTLNNSPSQEKSFAACLGWLAGVKKIQTSNRRHGTYGLKHMVERAAGLYVHEGTFVLAALASGFQIRPHVAGGLSGWLNVSEISLRSAKGFKS